MFCDQHDVLARPGHLLKLTNCGTVLTIIIIIVINPVPSYISLSNPAHSTSATLLPKETKSPSASSLVPEVTSPKVPTCPHLLPSLTNAQTSWCTKLNLRPLVLPERCHGLQVNPTWNPNPYERCPEIRFYLNFSPSRTAFLMSTTFYFTVMLL